MRLQHLLHRLALPPPPLSPPPLPSSKHARKRQSKKTKSKSKISRSLPSQTKIKSDNGISDGNNLNNISDVKNCLRLLFGNKHARNQKLYSCYCNYGESGVMICCDDCESWFHDECIGLTESQAIDYSIKNLPYVCAECVRLKSHPPN